MRKTIIKTISTFFYIGYLPFIPGTFGSITGICLYYLIKKNTPIVYTLFTPLEKLRLPEEFFLTGFTLLLIILGFLVTGEAEKILKKKDAKYIVIDEASGMLLSLIFLPYNIKLVILAFLLFRILDALKPYPAGKLQKLKGSIGVMSDDIIAGLYTNIILQVVLRLASFKIS